MGAGAHRSTGEGTHRSMGEGNSQEHGWGYSQDEGNSKTAASLKIPPGWGLRKAAAPAPHRASSSQQPVNLGTFLLVAQPELCSLVSGFPLFPPGRNVSIQRIQVNNRQPHIYFCCLLLLISSKYHCSDQYHKDSPLNFFLEFWATKNEEYTICTLNMWRLTTFKKYKSQFQSFPQISLQRKFCIQVVISKSQAIIVSKYSIADQSNKIECIFK